MATFVSLCSKCTFAEKQTNFLAGIGIIEWFLLLNNADIKQEKGVHRHEEKSGEVCRQRDGWCFRGTAPDRRCHRPAGGRRCNRRGVLVMRKLLIHGIKSIAGVGLIVALLVTAAAVAGGLMESPS